MSSSKQTDSTQTQTLDPGYKSLIYGNAARAQGIADVPYTPYTGDMVAGFNPTQLAAQGEYANIDASKVGAGTLASGISLTQGAAAHPYTPGQISSLSVAPAQVNRADIRNVTAGSIPGVDLNQYQNPWTQSVVDATAADVNHQLLVEQNQNASSATRAGAWRGNALGVTNAISASNTNRTLGATIAGLRSQGFDRATSLATGDMDRAQQASLANQGQDASVAGQNASFAQQASMANAGNALTAAQANQSSGLSAGLAGQQLQLAAGTQLANLSNQELTQAMQRAGLLESVGESQQAQTQAALNWAYQNNYLNKQDYDARMQQLVNQSLGLVPATGTTTGKTTETANDPLGAIGSLVKLGSMFIPIPK